MKEKENGRRSFLKDVLSGSLAASLAACQTAFNQERNDRVKRGEMFYRPLGRTNLLISEVSLGGSPLPDWAIMRQAIERGVNYIDTSESYERGNSERQIGQFFKEEGRDKVYVGTKFQLRGKWDEQTIIDHANSSLQRLNTDYVDVLLMHGVSDETHLTDERVVSAYETLKKQGKYRFRGISCHTNHHQVIQKAVESGFYDMVMLGYNVFDIQDQAEKIETYDDYLGVSGIRQLTALAKSKDIGVIAIKTLKVGGKRQNLDQYKTDETSLFQAMLKWVLENQNISSVATEMLTFGQLEEDLSVVGKVLTRRERESLYRYVLENSEDYCHLCGRCEQKCPGQIQTTAILHCLVYYESYRKVETARQSYSRINPDRTALSCQDCGECERVCPYGVSVREKIGKAHSLLA